MCEVTEELWSFITSPDDPCDELNYYGIRTFIAGTSETILKSKSGSLAQNIALEDARNGDFSKEQAIDLLQTKIEALKAMKK